MNDSSGDSGCNGCEDGGKLGVCAPSILGVYGEGTVMSTCIGFSACFYFGVAGVGLRRFLELWACFDSGVELSVS